MRTHRFRFYGVPSRRRREETRSLPDQTRGGGGAHRPYARRRRGRHDGDGSNSAAIFLLTRLVSLAPRFGDHSAKTEANSHPGGTHRGNRLQSARSCAGQHFWFTVASISMTPFCSLQQQQPRGRSLAGGHGGIT